MWPFQPRQTAAPVSEEAAPPPPKAPFPPETLVADIEFTWPEASRRVFKELGLHCHGCAAGEVDTLRDVARLHERPLEPILEALNRAFDGLAPEEPAPEPGIPAGTPKP